MAEKDKPSQAPASTDDTQNAPPVETDTPEKPESTSPPTSEGHEDKSTASESPPEKGHDDSEETVKKREEGKLRQVQEEYNRVKQHYSNLESAVVRDPEVYRKILKGTGVDPNTGQPLTDEQIDAQVKSVHPNLGADDKGKKPEQPTPAQPVLTQSQQAALNKVEYDEAQKQTARNEAVQKFQAKHPDLDPATTYSIGTEAFRLETTQGYDSEDALNEAYTKLVKPEEYRKQGETEGMAKALSGVSSSSQGPSGGASPKQEPAISAEDENAMNALGIADSKGHREKFAGYKQEE